MPASAAAARALETSVAFHDVLSDDGTRLRAWTNDPEGTIDGPTVVLCNGLGHQPLDLAGAAAPRLRRPGRLLEPPRHRRLRPPVRPRARAASTQFVEDGLSVMDHFGVDRAVLMGWSIGVNTMFELALAHPERVTGLFAVAGVPGDTFATMLGPLRLPRFAARAVTVGLSRAISSAAGRSPRRLPPAGRAARHRGAHPHRLHVPGPRPRAGRPSPSRSS